MPEPTPVAHACPPKGSGVMPCCGRTPFEAPRTDRISVDPFEVTCGQPTPVPPPADVRDQIAAALKSVTVTGGVPPTRLVPVLAPSPMTRITDWQPLDRVIDEVLAAPAIAEALTAAAEPTALKRAHIALAEQAGRDQAALERVRAECDRIEAAVRANPKHPDFDGAYLAAIGHIRRALNPQETL